MHWREESAWTWAGQSGASAAVQAEEVVVAWGLEWGLWGRIDRIYLWGVCAGRRVRRQWIRGDAGFWSDRWVDGSGICWVKVDCRGGEIKSLFWPLWVWCPFFMSLCSRFPAFNVFWTWECFLLLLGFSCDPCPGCGLKGFWLSSWGPSQLLVEKRAVRVRSGDVRTGFYPLPWVDPSFTVSGGYSW